MTMIVSMSSYFIVIVSFSSIDVCWITWSDINFISNTVIPPYPLGDDVTLSEVISSYSTWQWSHVPFVCKSIFVIDVVIILISLWGKHYTVLMLLPCLFAGEGRFDLTLYGKPSHPPFYWCRSSIDEIVYAWAEHDAFFEYSTKLDVLLQYVVLLL